jgi:hypothetical protein
MQPTLLKGYPDLIGRRQAWTEYVNGPASYVSGGDPVILPLYGIHIDDVFGPVYSMSGNYLATPIPSGVGPRQTWKLKWSASSTSSSGGSSAVTTRLGSAANYALLAATGITNTGATLITGGNAGSYATTTITGLTTANFSAPAAIDNANAQAAQTALAAAIVYYQGLTATISGLGNLSTGGNGSTASTYTPGVYVGSTSLTMPTGIILDAQGNPNVQFVFVAGSTINLASGQTVSLINGATAANVVFVAGSSFTSVATSTMNGNILAAVSITLGGGVQNGRALANTGAVTIAAATNVTVVSSINTSTGEVPAGTNLSAEVLQISGYCGDY